MDNTAFQYMINWVFNNVRDTPIPEICELCKKPYKEGHEQDCKKINELNIAAHDRFANFLERILRKRYQARKVCKDNDNRLEDRTKPDISIVVNGVQIYLDIGITWDLDKYYALKEQHYRDKKDQNGNPLKIIPIIIGKNLTIHQKSREFLEELRVNFETIYEEIGYMISTSQTHRAELMYRKKVVQRGEKHSEIDVEKPSANRFASLADSDVQFKHTDSYGKIFDYLHEKGMLKVATQSPIKEVPAKPGQKNFEKAHKTKTKKNSTQTAEKGNDKLEDTSTKKKLTNPPRPKQSPTRKAMTRKFSLSKRRSLKRQTMPKPSLKMRRKRLKQVRKPNLRRISKKKRLTKRSLRTLRSRKRKSPQSKSHKIKRPLQCPNRTQSLLKRKLRKRKRINNLSQKSLSIHSQKMVQMNKNNY
ncbi:Putative_reverse transcriptase/endonuclease [Hexamita inflata]|uniref:Reverse transcriptase/endonuclease n=1 Tax=Hexamita inflata TaxID=28002 RepID=A0AA86QZA9_9EUKA|nr:Putative reverse transcriptase/endonuclease [Hexamita inflata]